MSDMPPLVQALWPTPRLLETREPRPTIRGIVEQVACDYGITFAEITGYRDRTKLAPPRHEAMWRCYQTGLWSNTQIARVLGGRDHTTIIYGRHKHQALIDAMKVAAE